MKSLLVICGGKSTEHIISRMSCNSVLRNLDPNKYDVTLVGIDLAGNWYLLDKNIQDLTQDNWLDRALAVNDVFALLKGVDVVFPVLHGLYGEDGSIQGLFELAGVPYVGCRVLGSSLAMDKVLAKRIFAVANIPQVPSLYVKKRFDDQLVIVDEEMTEREISSTIVAAELGFPCFVKASNSGSSVGCYRVNKEEDLLTKIREASQYDRKILVEKAIDCIELEVAVLGIDDLTVSRVGQIMPHGEFYTFDSKYNDTESKTVIPALVDQDIQERIRELAKRAFKAIDGFGLSRVDFFYDKQTGKIYLNEVNTLPGFTNISMYSQLMADLGISYSELLDRLIELAK